MDVAVAIRAAPESASQSEAFKTVVEGREATMPKGHRETHRTGRIGWLRAAVLGANDGIVSTGSLIVGVAARQVAEQLMAHDALGAHARDELGISESLSARPVQAALASAGTFALGAALPLLMVPLAREADLVPTVSGTSLLFLAVLGALFGTAV
jgi:VIT1/CCC1 family predicted Fe2+/Mn2+ transporter